ncbi:MAG: trypsin-like peptidase domain-containing protein [Thermodesulfobacteriota bacterium]
MKALLSLGILCVVAVIALSGCVPATSTLWDDYRLYPNHKAYAIGNNEKAGAAWGQKTPKEAIHLALNYCKTSGGINCRVIDINNSPHKQQHRVNNEEKTMVSAATGFFVSEQTLVTAYHAISFSNNDKGVPPPCDSLAIRHGQSTFDAELVGADALNDIALLKTTGVKHNIAQLREDLRPQKGEPIMAFGYPFSSLLSDEAKITDGIINSTSGYYNDTRLLQISAPVQPGNSGGPLIDKSGAVAGIVLQSLSPAYTSYSSGEITIPQNVNFAIKSSLLIDFLIQFNISYELQNNSNTYTPIDIASEAGKYTAKVICYQEL